MAIQMLAAWNGYEQHAVYTLSGAEETRLIALGLARSYSGGAVQQSVRGDAVVFSDGTLGYRDDSAGGTGTPISTGSGSVAVQQNGLTAVAAAAQLNMLGRSPVVGAGSAANLFIGGQPIWAAEPRLVTEGDSLTDYENTGGQNWQLYFTLFTGARFYRPQGSNLAVGGQKISGLLGDATYISDATQIAAVRAQKPDVVTLMAGTNDIAGGATDVSGIINAFRTAISGYLASDGSFSGARYVVVGKIPPRNPITDATWTAAKERIRLQANAQIALLPAWDARVIIAETDSDNSAGSWDLTSANTSYQADGVHQSWQGMRIIARAFADAVAPILPQARPTHGYLGADNLCTNPMLYGTSGSMTGNAGSGVPVPTGQVADSWSVANNMNGIDIACSKTTLEGAVAQRMVFSGTLGTAGGTAFFTQTVTYSGAAGEGYECMFDIEIASGMSNIRGIYCLCDTATAPVSASTTPFVGDQVLRGTIRTKITAPLSGADTSSLVRLAVVASTAGQAVSLDIKVSKPYFRKSTAVAPI